MARIFLDGLESGGVDLFTANSGATVVSTSGLSMDGTYCLEINGSGDYVTKNVTAASEMYFAFLYRPTSYSNSIIAFYMGAVLLGQLRLSSTGNIVTYSSTTILQTSADILAIGTTYLIEVHYKIADSGGQLDVKLNGLQILTYLGDTKPGTETTFNSFRLGYVTSSQYGYAYYDNIILESSGWVGSTHIQALLPTAAGTTTEFTPSAGANYACVDERPASNADYVSINAVDKTDTYAMGDLVGAIGAIKAVQVQARVVREGDSVPLNIKLAVRSGGSDYLSANNAIPSSASGVAAIWEVDPDTSSAWLSAGVNAIETGFKTAA